jgi:dihydropteroate synthase
VTVAEEIRRTVPFVAAVRAAHPDVVISVDTWRHEVARELCAAGADLINDTWGGWDPGLASVAASCGVGLVCSHAGGLPPRTRPFRVSYPDVMVSVLERTLALAERAVALGVDPARVLIDPAHDFGKNTWHSLEITRRLDEMVATGWPVLVSVSHKDFVGETLDAGREDRLTGTLATTAVCAWLGARVFRAHQVTQTRQVLDMVSAIRGELPPARAVRGLALCHLPAGAVAGPGADRARSRRRGPAGRVRGGGGEAGRGRSRRHRRGGDGFPHRELAG